MPDQKPDDSDQLQYATPMPPKVGSPEIAVPYLLFGVFAVFLAAGIVLMHSGTPGGETFGMAIAVPSAIGSIVLPIIAQMREK